MPDRLIRQLGLPLAGEGDLLVMRGRVIELVDDARRVMAYPFDQVAELLITEIT